MLSQQCCAGRKRPLIPESEANEVLAQYSSDCSWHDWVEHNNTTNKAIYLK